MLLYFLLISLYAYKNKSWHSYIIYIFYIRMYVERQCKYLLLRFTASVFLFCFFIVVVVLETTYLLLTSLTPLTVLSVMSNVTFTLVCICSCSLVLLFCAFSFFISVYLFMHIARKFALCRQNKIKLRW